MKATRLSGCQWERAEQHGREVLVGGGESGGAAPWNQAHEQSQRREWQGEGGLCSLAGALALGSPLASEVVTCVFRCWPAPLSGGAVGGQSGGVLEPWGGVSGKGQQASLGAEHWLQPGETSPGKGPGDQLEAGDETGNAAERARPPHATARPSRFATGPLPRQPARLQKFSRPDPSPRDGSLEQPQTLQAASP